MLAALALPGLAGAGPAASPIPEAASKGQPFSVNFTVVSRDGKPIKVKKFRFQNLPITCDQGDFLLSNKIGGQIPVEDRHFEATATDDDPPSEENVRGRFVRPTKVKGRVKAEGTYETTGAGQITHCTGAKRFTAS